MASPMHVAAGSKWNGRLSDMAVATSSIIALALIIALVVGQANPGGGSSTSTESLPSASSQLTNSSSSTSSPTNTSSVILPRVLQLVQEINNQSARGAASLYTNSSVLHLSGDILVLGCLPWRGPFAFNGTSQIESEYSQLFAYIAISPSAPYFGQLASISGFSATQVSTSSINASFNLFLTDHVPGNADTNATILVQQLWTQANGVWYIQDDSWNYTGFYAIRFC